MSDPCVQLRGYPTLHCAAEGKLLGDDRDAVELIGEALQVGAKLVVIPMERFESGFFDLRTCQAGGIVQKFVQYRRHLVIVGDVSRYCERSSAFTAFLVEANRGEAIWFVRDLAELDQRLAQLEDATGAADGERARTRPPDA